MNCTYHVKLKLQTRAVLLSAYFAVLRVRNTPQEVCNEKEIWDCIADGVFSVHKALKLIELIVDKLSVIWIWTILV